MCARPAGLVRLVRFTITEFPARERLTEIGPLLHHVHIQVHIQQRDDRTVHAWKLRAIPWPALRAVHHPGKPAFRRTSLYPVCLCGRHYTTSCMIELPCTSSTFRTGLRPHGVPCCPVQLLVKRCATPTYGFGFADTHSGPPFASALTLGLSEGGFTS